MKKYLTLLLALATVLALTACSGGTSGSTPSGGSPSAGSSDDSSTSVGNTSETALTAEDLGTIWVGIDGSYPPFCYLNDNNEVDGFEVAVMKEISARTGLDIQCQICAWSGMFGQLDSGRIDTVGESITITPEKEEDYIFSKSYITDSNRFMVRAGEESSIASFEDLEGKRIGVASGQTAYNQLVAIQEEYGVNFEIVPYETSTNANDVALGRLDASYMNPIAGMTASNTGDLNLAVADCPAYAADLCAYPFVKDSERAQLICQIFSETLTEMEADGTLSELCVEWLGTDVSHVE